MEANVYRFRQYNPAMQNECAFCPSTATLTGEHLWSNWMNAIFPTTKYRFSRTDMLSKKLSSWEAKGLNLKAKVVCKRCNETWMSEIDSDEAKPILQHLITDLTSRELPIRVLISIGLFAFKTAVIGDHMTNGGDPFFTREERFAFRDRLLFPSAMRMWLGAMDTMQHGVFKTRHIKPSVEGKNSVGLYAFTYGAGHFVLQLVAARWRTHNPERLLPVIDQTADHEPFLSSFWPPTSNVVWPPQKYFNAQLVSHFANRWNDFQFIAPPE